MTQLSYRESSECFFFGNVHTVWQALAVFLRSYVIFYLHLCIVWSYLYIRGGIDENLGVETLSRQAGRSERKIIKDKSHS